VITCEHGGNCNPGSLHAATLLEAGITVWVMPVAATLGYERVRRIGWSGCSDDPSASIKGMYDNEQT
jgi:hypothetical protein